MTDVSPRIVEFSTDLIPEPDRAAVWREHYGQLMLRVDLEPAPGLVFEARNRALTLPGLQLMEAQASPVRVSRNGRYLADGNDDVVVAINRAGSALIESVGRSHVLRDGTTFSEFLTRLRLSRAHRLLCEPASSHAAIATIAYDIGFGDLSYFNRRFRRQYGQTPREVRGDRAR